MKDKKKVEVTREEAERGAVRKIILVVAAGVILIIADLIMCNAKDHVELIESGEGLYMMRPPVGSDPMYGALIARVQGSEGLIEKKINVELEPMEDGRDDDSEEKDDDGETAVSEEERIKTAVTDIAGSFNDNVNDEKVQVPAELESGEKISWETDKTTDSNGFVIVMMTMMIAFFIYRTRFSAIEKRKREERESVMMRLPEFVNRLVLLLNAGLVLTSAFERSVEETMGLREYEDDYFYGKLMNIYGSVKKANGSVHMELAVLAKESGIRELMRVSNIINDNIKKGVELTDKLQTESQVLWHSRKKNCEEKSSLAETKLTMPLMIFLMVLITITVAPALMEL